MSAKKKEAVTKVTMRPGRYWLGDPCHVIRDDAWDHWLEKADEGYDEDRVTFVATLPGRRRVVAFAAHRDGLRVDTDGFRYPVDSGLIGLVPVAAREFSEPRSGMGRYVTFDQKAECVRKDRTLHFGDIAIRIA